MFDLRELKKLAEKQNPSAIVIVDTNVLMNNPYFNQWKTQNKFIFVISSTVHNELIVLKNKHGNPDKQGKAEKALGQINRLYNSEEAITKGIAVSDIGWFISISDPDKNAVNKESTNYGLLPIGLKPSDMELFLLAKECRQTLAPRTSLLATGDQDFFAALRQRNIYSYLFTGQWSKLSEYIEQIRKNPEEIKSSDEKSIDEALAYIYIAQRVRLDGPTGLGVLTHDCGKYDSQIKELMSKGEVQEKKPWPHLNCLVTTQQGTQKAITIVSNRLLSQSASLNSEFEKMPRRLLQYIIQNVLLADVFTFELQTKPSSWEAFPFYCLLANNDVLEVRDTLFQVLQNMQLMVISHEYVATNGGEVRDALYVQASELKPFFRDYLVKANLARNVWPQEKEEMHQVFHVLGNIRDLTQLKHWIPVSYRESVNDFISECQTKKIIVESTDSKGKSFTKIADVLAYEAERTKRYQKPLIDFLLGQNPSPVPPQPGRISGGSIPEITRPEVPLVKPPAKIQQIFEPPKAGPAPLPYEITFPPYDDGKKLVFGRGVLKDKIAWGFEVGKPFSVETLVTSDLYDINQPHVGSFQQTRTGKSTLASCVILQAAFQGVPVVVIDPKPDYVSSLIPVTKTVSVYPDHKGPIEKRFTEAKQDIRGFDFTRRVEFEQEDDEGNRSKRSILFQVYSFDKDLRELPNCSVLKLPLLVLPPVDDADFDDQCNAAATSLVSCLSLGRGKAVNTLLAGIMKKFRKENPAREFMLKKDIEHELELLSAQADKVGAKKIVAFRDALDDYYTQNSFLFASDEAEIVKMDSMVQNPGFEDGDKQTVTISIIDVSALPQEKNNPVMLNYVSQVCGQLYNFVKRKRSEKGAQLFIVFDEAQNYLPDPSNQYNYARVVINRGASLGIKAWLMAQSPQAVEKEARKQFTALVLSKVNEASVRDEVSKYVQSDSWTDKLKQTGLGKALIISSDTGKEGGKLCVVFTTPQTVDLLSPKQIVKALNPG